MINTSSFLLSFFTILPYRDDERECRECEKYKFTWLLRQFFLRENIIAILCRFLSLNLCKLSWTYVKLSCRTQRDFANFTAFLPFEYQRSVTSSQMHGVRLQKISCESAQVGGIQVRYSIRYTISDFHFEWNRVHEFECSFFKMGGYFHAM